MVTADQANVIVNAQNEAGNADTQTESLDEGMERDEYAIINSTTDGRGSWLKGLEDDATRH